MLCVCVHLRVASIEPRRDRVATPGLHKNGHMVYSWCTAGKCEWCCRVNPGEGEACTATSAAGDVWSERVNAR
jgi:hypothetical protein